MTTSRHTRRMRGGAAIAAVGALALVLSACSGGDGGTDDGGTDSETSTEAGTDDGTDTGTDDGGDGGSEAGGAEIDCAAYEEFGDLSGKSVSVYTSIVEPESDDQKESYKPFEECTGVTIDYEGSREFEAQLLVRLQAGNAPDIAYMPQPGLLQTIVTDYPDSVVKAPEATLANVEEYWNDAWKAYGTVDGEFYAAPLGSNVKSYIWYSPSMFADAGYDIPETWDDLMSLSEEIATKAEAGETALPWCAGVESGDATGWPGTDFIEDMVLRTVSLENYDKWTSGELSFDSPEIINAFNTAGEILKNDKFVNAGLGGVASIATTPWGSAGLGILDGTCWMHRAANFYAAQLPEGTNVAPDGDIWAFYFPGNGTEKPVLVGGEFVLAFDERPEVQAFQTYLASADWANNKAKATPDGGWVSSNSGLQKDNLATEFDRLSYDILNADPEAQRFDGSDLMPGAVGAGTFWDGVVNWLTGSSTEDVVKQIAAGWPAS